jgi:hypothetical protein
VTTSSGSTATVAPTVTYVQTTPAPAYPDYYYQPNYYPVYGYPFYPAVSFSFGWGPGWHGGGWGGGYGRGGHGGWHR